MNSPMVVVVVGANVTATVVEELAGVSALVPPHAEAARARTTSRLVRVDQVLTPTGYASSALETSRPAYADLVMEIVVVSIVIVLLVTVAVAVIGIRAVARGRAAQNEQWLTTARALSLSFEPETFTARARLSGTVDGIGVEVRSIVESTGKSSARYTRYRASYPSLGLGLKVMATGGWQKLSTWFGGQDVATGDQEFDPAVTVKGHDDDAVRRFLSPSRRVSAHRLIVEFPGVVIEDASITWRMRGLEADGQRLMTVVRRMVGVAQRLTESAAGADRAMEARAVGSPGEAAGLLRDGNLGLEDQIDLAEASYVEGRFEEAEETLAALESALPADAQVAAWRRRAGERKVLGALPASSDDEVITEPEAVAAELFDPGLLSFDATRLFEEEYEQRRVRWRGTVMRSSAYRSDQEFGSGPGVRAVVRVYRLGWDLYGGRDVDAVVALPEGTVAAVGSEITFEGHLVRADTLMRNLFVADGRLVA